MFAHSTLLDIVIFITALFMSTALHELMHAWVALKLGDDLAHSRGRITLNPLAHIDPFLTIVLPVVLLLTTGTPIMAAKPVPINTSRLRGGDMGMAIVGVAGPLTNLALAILFGGILRFINLPDFGLQLVQAFFYINVGLFVFNMLPIPPLDGSRVLYAFAPESVQRVMEQIESFGVFFVIIIITVFASVVGPLLESLQNGLIRILLG